MKKKRNPQDATLRNIRALKKRVELLEFTIIAYDKRFKFIEKLTSKRRER